MKLHEYQAKAILASYGIPVPRGGVASTPAEARQIAQDLGGKAVVKAQVHAGGRGKAGGIKLVSSPQEAESAAASLIGRHLITYQTGPQGVPVGKVLVEEPAAVAKELYLGIVVDGSVGSPVIIVSEAGGVEIEEVARTSPEKLHTLAPDPAVGFQGFYGRRLAYAMNLPADLIRPATDLMGNLYRLFIEKDCSLAEINPLVITQDNRLLALDAKLNLEDDALFRHRDLQALRDATQEDSQEAEAEKFDVSFVHLDGDVGCLVNGAGLAMATMDLVKAAGADPANFLDVGGMADEAKIKGAFSIMLRDPKVRRFLINVFGGILRCDMVANGVVAACKEAGVRPSLVVRMRGTNADMGRQILRESGLNVTLVDEMAQISSALRQLGK
ncbi:MAG: ADP-forming succinate--CoA ligase subunit beta [Chloroflexi bacterium]|nr:ADP-forming succinate--CoA ligase subunit beta [Chloroflexota bacterium]